MSTAGRRAPWRLQTKLIVLVVSLVSLILVIVALATGAALRTIMAENLDAQVSQIASRTKPSAALTAAQALAARPSEPGTLLISNNLAGDSGAHVDDDGDVVALTTAQLDRLAAQPVDPSGWTYITVDGLGEYRVKASPTSTGFIAVGMPTSELTRVLGQIVTSVALITLAGLLVLAVAISLLIRRSLAPLRAVAATATHVAALPLAEGAVSIAERVPAAQADERTETGRVGAALNTLLDHVDESLAARQRNEERMRAFVADASHELRTPLASIRGYSELSLRTIAQNAAQGAAQGSDATDTTTEALERIQAQSLRMTTLVEDLLLLARLDEGAELVYGAVDLTRLAIEAVSDARAAGPDHAWVLEVGDEPVVVAGDATRLHQVAANLLANARVHTPAGTTVTTSVVSADGRAVLRVHDDGPGIDPAVAGELFQRFSRADRSRARRSGGTGLGLSIAKAIVEAHGGTIDATSEPGSTTFEVRLPARPDAP